MKFSLDNISSEVIRELNGVNNTNIKTLEELLNIDISLNNEVVYTSTNNEDDIALLKRIFSVLIEASKYSSRITSRDISYLVNLAKDFKERDFLKLYKDKKVVNYTYNNRPIYAKTLKQIEYLENLNANTIIFALGAAGTGKTYLAVSYAVSLLKKNEISKIILTRPAVEAGENLGFLPGDLKEKVDPYLRPLYDALYDNLGLEQTEKLIGLNIIEIAPLAYMRGRTLENAFIILDEAQNATKEQLKMFLTRLGFNSKMVITGDPSQVDLKKPNDSGLTFSANLLKDIKEVGVINFLALDVVRHPLVQKIIEAFRKEEN